MLSEDEKGDIEISNRFKLSVDSITTSTGLFNNIKSVNFTFEDECLKSIFIPINSEQSDSSTVVNYLLKLMSSRLGKCTFEFENNTVWRVKNRTISLTKNMADAYISIN